MEDRLTILLIEDNPSMPVSLRRCASIVGPLTWITRLNPVWRRDYPVLEQAASPGFLLDLNLPDNQGIETLVRVESEFPEIPIIVLTGQEDEAIAVEAVKQGAQDYLVKGTVDGNQLVRSLRYAIERKRIGGRPY